MRLERRYQKQKLRQFCRSKKAEALEDEKMKVEKRRAAAAAAAAVRLIEHVDALKRHRVAQQNDTLDCQRFQVPTLSGPQEILCPVSRLERLVVFSYDRVAMSFALPTLLAFGFASKC